MMSFFGEPVRSRAFKIAVFLHIRGQPLPIDLQTRLLQEGVDLSLFDL